MGWKILLSAEWFEDFDWEGHLRDAIDSLELDCVSRLMEPSYHTCINVLICLMYLIRIV